MGPKLRAPPPPSERATLPRLAFTGEPRAPAIPKLPPSTSVLTMHVRSTPSPLCGLRQASPPAMPHIVYPKATGLLSPSTSCVGENPIGPSRAKQHLLYSSFFLSPVLRAYRRLSERCASVITMVALSKRAAPPLLHATVASPHAVVHSHTGASVVKATPERH
jgi:hypothetical protein